MNENCKRFVTNNLTCKEIKCKKVIEIGSRDVNGSIRPNVELCEPSEYMGVDIEKGHGVDKICFAEDLEKTFGKEKFDIVITTELLEHVKDWKNVISNIKNICKSNGIIIITTRSYGFPYHGYPYDFWRYELKDMKNIFSDCEIIAIEKDPDVPGIFIKVKKPNNFLENDLSKYELYNIINNKKTIEISEKDLKSFNLKYKMFKEKLERSIIKARILKNNIKERF